MEKIVATVATIIGIIAGVIQILDYFQKRQQKKETAQTPTDTITKIEGTGGGSRFSARSLLKWSLVILVLLIVNFLIFFTRDQRVKLILPPLVDHLVQIDNILVLKDSLEMIRENHPLEIGSENEIVCNSNCFIIGIDGQIIRYFALEYNNKLFDLKSSKFLKDSNFELSTVDRRILLLYEWQTQKLLSTQPPNVRSKLLKTMESFDRGERQIFYQKFEFWLSVVIIPIVINLISPVVKKWIDKLRYWLKKRVKQSI